MLEFFVLDVYVILAVVVSTNPQEYNIRIISNKDSNVPCIVVLESTPEKNHAYLNFHRIKTST